MATLRPMIVVVGETASGKTALGIELAQRFNGEIICADSRTVYRGMDIGTAKPTAEERAKVPHHLIDIRNPDEKYSAAQFKQDASKVLKDLENRGKLSVVVGGTGLYIDALLYDYQFPASDRSADNPRHATAATHDRTLRDNTLVIGLRLDKEELENRIQRRVQTMLDAGLLDEAKWLVERYRLDNEPLRGAGYYIWDDYLHGRITMDEAIQKFARVSTLLAKKQRTWFKRNKSIHWLNNRGNAVAITTTFLNNLSN